MIKTKQTCWYKNRRIEMCIATCEFCDVFQTHSEIQSKYQWSPQIGCYVLVFQYTYIWRLVLVWSKCHWICAKNMVDIICVEAWCEHTKVLSKCSQKRRGEKNLFEKRGEEIKEKKLKNFWFWHWLHQLCISSYEQKKITQ